MRYLMVDQITEWKSNDFIAGVKNVAMSEDFLEFHFPKNPILPGALILEALVQLAGWLEAVSSDFNNWFLISNIKKCSFYGFAYPGDQVKLEVKCINEKEPSGKIFRGIGNVKGKKIISAEFEGEIIPLSDLEDTDEQKRTFDRLTRGSQ